MKIMLAEPRGFCVGVRRAVELLEKTLNEYPTPIFVYHEIVHNSHVVDSFKQRGAVFVDSVDVVPRGAVLLFSAHGVSPEIKKQALEKDLITIDATCPLVARIHQEALLYAQKGYRIILFGHRGHDEVVGTMGEAPNQIDLVTSLEEIDQLDFLPDQKVTCLMQTTLLAQEADRLLAHLRVRVPQLEIPDHSGICRATGEHQEAVRRAIPECDTVLVVGSANSSNTRRLYELARLLGSRAFMADSADDLQKKWFDGTKKLLVTSGASVPEVLVSQCVEKLNQWS